MHERHLKLSDVHASASDTFRDQKYITRHNTRVRALKSRGGLGRLATWHLPGGPVGPPARWAATSNVEGGSGTEEGPLARAGRLG